MSRAPPPPAAASMQTMESRFFCQINGLKFSSFSSLSKKIWGKQLRFFSSLSESIFFVE